MEESALKNILSRLKNLSIVVIGDFFLDKYLQIDCKKNELSLETRLTAYQVIQKRLSPGAAGTVTNNLRALGVGRVIALGFVGNDGEGFDLIRGLKNSGVITKYMVKTQDRITPSYIKPVFIKNSAVIELNRFDIKNWTPTSKNLEDKIIEMLSFLAKNADAIVVLDQVSEENCGMITERVQKFLSGLNVVMPNLVVYVDSRVNISKFKNLIIKCNHYEAVKAIEPELKGKPGEQSIKKAGLALTEKTGKPVFITYGKNGILVFNNRKIEKIPAVYSDGPFDKCGAGDAATTGIVSALCCGASLQEAAFLGNIISSITIQQIGATGTASQKQVLQRYQEHLNHTV
jgi:rfaE bifunctional protein kinase chain/domain